MEKKRGEGEAISISKTSNRKTGPARPLEQKDHIELKRLLCTLRDPDTHSPNDGFHITMVKAQVLDLK